MWFFYRTLDELTSQNYKNKERKALKKIVNRKKSINFKKTNNHEFTNRYG